MVATDVKASLLKAALKLYAEHGSRGATTRRIAQEAGVNEVTLFRHYPSKQALLHAAIHSFAEETPVARLPETPKDLAAELEAWARDHHRNLYKLRTLIRTVMGEFEEHPDHCKQTLCLSVRIANELTDYLATAQRLGMASRDFEPAAATTLLMGTLFDDAMGRDLMPERFTFPMRDSITHYMNLFLRAIGATRS